MKILLIEDDPIWQSKICGYLEELGYETFSICDDFKLVSFFIDQTKPDLILSDIMLGSNNVFDIFDYQAPDIPILFITTSEEEQLYQKSLLLAQTQYLVKPFHKISLQAAMDNLLRDKKKRQEQAEGRYITVRGTNNEKITLYSDQVVFVVSELNYCVIKTPKNQFAFKSSLERIQQALGNDLIRTHKSYLVNRNYILKVDLSQKSIETKLGSIPVGRLYKPNLQTYLASIKPI